MSPVTSQLTGMQPYRWMAPGDAEGCAADMHQPEEHLCFATASGLLCEFNS